MWPFSSFKRRRVNRLQAAVMTLQNAGLVRAKDIAELVEEGGWDVLGANNLWTKASDIWKSFSTGELEKIYRLSALVRACVQIKCTAAPEADMMVGYWEDGHWIELEDHPIVQLLRQPNPQMDRRTFLWRVNMHRELTGESYILKGRMRSGIPESLTPIPTSWVSPKYDRLGTLTHYEVSYGMNRKKRVNLSDMMVWRYPDPQEILRGCGPLQSALRDYQVDDARASLLIEVLTNIHFPGITVKTKDILTEPQKEEVRKILKDLIGPGKRGDPLFLGGGEAELELPKAPQDMDWPGTASLSETRICASFGVPPILAHVRAGLERSTYSNYEQAKRSFYTDTMRPLWYGQSAIFEQSLLRNELEDTQIEIEPDFSDVPELQEDEDEIHKRAREDYHGGMITQNMALERIGEENIGEAGEHYLRPMNLIEYRIDGDATVPPERPEPESEDETGEGHEEAEDWEEGDDEEHEAEDTAEETGNEEDEDVAKE